MRKQPNQQVRSAVIQHLWTHAEAVNALRALMSQRRDWWYNDTPAPRAQRGSQ